MSDASGEARPATKLAATRTKVRLRGLGQPAQAGFAMVAATLVARRAITALSPYTSASSSTSSADTEMLKALT